MANESRNTLFGFETPEEIKTRIMGDFSKQQGALLQRLGTGGGAGLAGRLAELGRAAGAALVAQSPEVEKNPEVLRAQTRQHIIDRLSAEEGSDPTTSQFYSNAMKVFMEEGDMVAAQDALKKFAQLSTIEAAKTKVDRGDKPTITKSTVMRNNKPTVVQTAVDPQSGKVLWTREEGEAKPPKPPAPRDTKVSKTDVEFALTQAKNLYKDMDFADEYDAETHDPFLNLVAGEVNKRAEDKRMDLTPANRIKLTRQVLKDARKAEVIKTDTNLLGFKEPVMDQSKMDQFFGITGSVAGGGLTPEQKKRLEELRAKQKK